jgi:hypothetical protein
MLYSSGRDKKTYFIEQNVIMWEAISVINNEGRKAV